MKIRIKDNFVRYRLTQSEVKQFCETGKVVAHTRFPENELLYQVIQHDDIKALSAGFENGNITLKVPSHLARDWYTNELVGFQNEITLEDGTVLSLLLEKDFVCLDDTMEDQSDNYPNPKAAI
ncbi:DUF7009 family protein [Flagellimonas allohymeniacidonis]|uniref:Uncharacterized protein n=1 Tax=Flagellimonas allohymeniacidonis TaxID=2517819 RepID=A0A4Q8QA69_9FLAO|nr:hypothetical protein [Allomuricauda hymeniacidonis]TAI47185.1 hypothetical protein EW142_10890 [Allomuricauda hymeniacidonis]